jgi:hypothetical protein
MKILLFRRSATFKLYLAIFFSVFIAMSGKLLHIIPSHDEVIHMVYFSSFFILSLALGALSVKRQLSFARLAALIFLAVVLSFQSKNLIDAVYYFFFYDSIKTAVSQAHCDSERSACILLLSENAFGGYNNRTYAAYVSKPSMHLSGPDGQGVQAAILSQVPEVLSPTCAFHSRPLVRDLHLLFAAC